MKHWTTAVLILLAVAVIAAPSHATRTCTPEIVAIKIHGKPLVGHTLHTYVRARCTR